MSNTKSKAILGSEPQPNPVGSEVVNIMLQTEVAAADLASGDLIIMGELPEDCALVDAMYGFDDLDSGGAGLTMSFGVVNADEDDLDTVLDTGGALSTIPNTGGAGRMIPTVANMTVVSDSIAGKVLGYKVTGSATAGAAGTALLGLSYRSVHYDG